jgi:arsenite methyltransferase
MEKDLQIEEKIKERYGKIALFGNSDSCCIPSSECCNTKEIDNNDSSIRSAAKSIGYSLSELIYSSIINFGSWMWQSRQIYHH